MLLEYDISLEGLRRALSSASQTGRLPEILPLDGILAESLFYPGSGADFGDIFTSARLLRDEKVCSFVHCDYSTPQSTVLEALASVPGYELCAWREVRPEELTDILRPTGDMPQRPPKSILARYSESARYRIAPYIIWAVLRRTVDSGDIPELVSVLHVCGEAVASYQSLYWSAKRRPLAVALINPGAPGEGNWTDFYDEGQALEWMISHNPGGEPDFFLVGEDGASDFNWHGLHATRKKVKDYYSKGNGTVRLWNREDGSISLSGLLIAENYDNKPIMPIRSRSANRAEPVTYEDLARYYRGGFTQDFEIYFKVDRDRDIPVVRFSPSNPLRGSRPASCADADRMFVCLTWYISLFPLAIREIIGEDAMMDFHRSSPWPIIRLESGETGAPEDILREAELLPSTAITRRKLVRVMRTTILFMEDELEGFLRQDKRGQSKSLISAGEMAHARLVRAAKGHIRDILQFCADRTSELCLNLESEWGSEELKTV